MGLPCSVLKEFFKRKCVLKFALVLKGIKNLLFFVCFIYRKFQGICGVQGAFHLLMDHLMHSMFFMRKFFFTSNNNAILGVLTVSAWWS